MFEKKGYIFVRKRGYVFEKDGVCLRKRDNVQGVFYELVRFINRTINCCTVVNAVNSID